MRIDCLKWLIFPFILLSCTDSARKKNREVVEDTNSPKDTLIVVQEVPRKVDILPKDILFEKELLYDQYTLEEVYPYKDTIRLFQWDKMRKELVKVENVQRDSVSWGVFQNRQNKNGESPLVKKFARNAYKRIADTLGVERFQSVPLYLLTDTVVPEIYGRDGSLAQMIGEEGSFYHVKTIYKAGEFYVPKKYVKSIETKSFTRVAMVDRTNQNIATLEKESKRWLVRSMNPATTGLYKPPYQLETPTGIFVVQEKKEKMYYLEDGTTRISGFSPYASRFCNGGYIHGVPVNNPKGNIVEYSYTLGTIPRSHMCVRNASSHAQFVYEWALLEKSLVIVIE